MENNVTENEITETVKNEPANESVQPLVADSAEEAIEVLAEKVEEATPVVEATPAEEIAPVVETPIAVLAEPKALEIEDDGFDFASMVDESLKGLTLRFRRGAQVKGTVCGMDDKSVFLNVRSTQEGVVDRREFLNDEGEMTVKIGDAVDAMVVDNRNDILLLTVKMDGVLAAQHLGDAFKAGLPVEGKFAEERKGGYTVDIGGVDAFCPYSQADLRPLPEGTSLVGMPGVFLITQLTEDGDCVVSRRRVLEQERSKKRDALKYDLKVGDKITGEVTRVMDFGAFVELGGIEGMIPASELSWSGRRMMPSEVLSVGDRAEVMVKDIDWDRDRVSLSYRGAKIPWENIIEEFHEGRTVRGTVVRMESFGVFVELGNDVEGLLHVNEMSNYFHKRIKRPEDVYQIGDEVSVTINKIDMERHRISLVLPNDGTHMTWDEIADEFTPGTLCEGVITRIEPFGVFVELEDELEGLLHISKIGSAMRRHLKSPEEVYQVNDEVVVEVESVDPERHRISLRLPPKAVTAEEATHTIEVGETYEGTVKFLKPFGVIIDLGNRNTGLLHQSQTGDKVIHKVGDKVTVVVESIGDDNKISLVLPESLAAKAEEAELREWFAQKTETQKAENAGSMADAFDALNIEF